MFKNQLQYRPTPQHMLDLQKKYTLPSYPIPSSINTLLVALHVLIYIGMAYGMPILLHSYPGHTWLWFVSGSMVTVFQASQAYSLGHEGFHDLLHHKKNINYHFSRLISICSGTPLYILRYPHLIHHRNNGTYKDLGRHELAAPNLPMAWLELFGGAMPMLRVIFLACFLPQKYHGKFYEFLPKVKGSQLRDIRVDMVVIILTRIITLYLWGLDYLLLWIWFSWLGDFFISFYCPIFHQGGPMTDKWHSWNLYLPAPLRLCFLNFNMHQIHHLYPSVPWIYYPTIWKEVGVHWDASLWHGTLTQIIFHHRDIRMIRQQYNDYLESRVGRV
jgi:beta-carotene hydroxylase